MRRRGGGEGSVFSPLFLFFCVAGGGGRRLINMGIKRRGFNKFRESDENCSSGLCAIVDF